MNSGITVSFTGRLAKEPHRTTSRTGTTWTRLCCDIPVYDTENGGPSMTWIRVGVPGERGDEFMNLEIGAEIRVVGMLCLNSYSKNGRSLIGMSVIPTEIERVPQTPGPVLDRSPPFARARVIAEEPPGGLKHEARGERRRRDFHGSEG